MSPAVWVYYDFASGDDFPGVGNTRSTFQQLFPFGHYYFGFLDLVGRQNIKDVNLHRNFYLDTPRDALYGAAGQVLRRSAAGTAGTTLGQEIDLLINFHLDNHQDVLFGRSHLFAGEFIRATAPNIRAGRAPDFFYAQYTYRW